MDYVVLLIGAGIALPVAFCVSVYVVIVKVGALRQENKIRSQTAKVREAA